MNNPTVKFVELTLNRYIEKFNTSDDNDQLQEDCLYFVSTNYTEKGSTNLPYLLFKGKNMIGNSGLLVREATDGIIKMTATDFTVSPSPTGIASLSINQIPIFAGTIKLTFKSEDTEIHYIDRAISDFEGEILKEGTSEHFGTVDYTTSVITFDTNSLIYTSAHKDNLSISCDYGIGIFVSEELSTNIQGVPGQTMFIINRFTDEHNNSGYLTYLYFWDNTNPIIDGYGNILTKGRWQNAHLGLIESYNSFGTYQFTLDEVIKLKAFVNKKPLDDIYVDADSSII